MCIFGGGEVHKGQLNVNRTVKIVEEVTPRPEDCVLVLILVELIIDILIPDGFGITVVRYPADAVRPHPLVRNRILRGYVLLISCLLFCAGYGRFDLLTLCAGQLSFCGQYDRPPCLAGPAYRAPYRNCWSCTGAASGAGTSRS